MRQPSPSSTLAIGYITGGVLLTIWAAVWYYFLSNDESGEPVARWKWYVCIGLLCSGIAIAVIGVLVGRIGREAQHADATIGQLTGAIVTPNTPNGQVLPANTGAVAPGVGGQAVVPTTVAGSPRAGV